MEIHPIFQKLHLEGIASTHQADKKYGQYAGSQCLSNCVMFLVSSYYNDETPITSLHGLNDILKYGAKIDFILRRSGQLGHNQYAQLHHIPGFIVGPEWACFIYQSIEMFGMLGYESPINEPFVASLKSLLSKNYNTTVQYFLAICNSKSMGILIKEKKIFIFDPHSCPLIPNSPAHVLSTSNVNDAIEYLSPPNAQYTGSFLYFVPKEYIGHSHYIMNHYRVITYEKLHGPNIDLTTQEGIIIEVSPPNTPKPTRTPKSPKPSKTPTTPKAPKVSSPPKTPKPSANPYDKSSKPAKAQKPPKQSKNPSSKNTTLTPKHTTIEEHLQEFSQSEANKEQEHTPFSHPTERKTPGTDSLLSGINSNKRKREDDLESNGNVSSKLKEDEDGWIDDIPTLNVSDTEATNSDQETIYMIGDENIHDWSYVDDDTDDTLDINFVQLDKVITSLQNIPINNTFPTIIDKPSNRHIKEGKALHAIDRILTNIIIEHGLITSPPNSMSKCKSLLQFVVLWSEKLSIPTKDLKTLLKTNLIITEIAKVASTKLTNNIFKNNIITKLNKCMEKIKLETGDNYKQLLALISHKSTTIQYATTEIELKNISSMFTSELGEDFSVICTNEEYTAILLAIENLKEKIFSRKQELHAEEIYFQSVIIAMETFQPIPLPTKVLEIQPLEKSKVFLEKLKPVEQKLTTEVNELLTDLLHNIKQDATEILPVPDFTTILKNIQSTLQLLHTCVTDLNIDKEVIGSTIQQLSYIGWEVAELSHKQWNFPPASPIIPLQLLDEIKTEVQRVTAKQQTQETLNQILSDVQSLLSQAEQSSTLSIPILQHYITQAGTLVGESKNETFESLRDTVQKLSTSEEFLKNLINSTTLLNIQTQIKDISDILLSNQYMYQSETIKHAFLEKSNTLIGEAIQLINLKKYTDLTQPILIAVKRFLSEAKFKDSDNIYEIIYTLTSIGSLLSNSPTIEALKDTLKSIDTLKPKLATVSKPLKRELYNVMRKLQKDLKTQLQKQELENWKMEVETFASTPGRDVNAFIQSAPSTKARKYAKEVLKDQIQEMDIDVSPESIIDDNIKANGQKAWKKIQSAFQDLNFSILTADDWLSLAKEYSRPDSSLFTTIGPTLLKLVEEVFVSIQNIKDAKLKSLLPNGPAFTSPKLDWIHFYEDNVNFHLKTINLPKISTIAHTIGHELSMLSQALNSKTLPEAVVGTPLEQHAAKFSCMFKTLEATWHDHQVDTRTKIDEYIEDLRNDTKKHLVAPQIQAPVRFLTPEDIQEMNTLPQMFKDSLLDNENRLLSSQKNEFRMLENTVKAAEAQYKATQEEIISNMTDAINSLLPLAPPYILTIPTIPTDPLKYVENIIHDKHLINAEPYYITLECLNWLNTTCKTLLSICPKSQKQRLVVIDQSINKNINIATHLYNLEKTANTTEDPTLLKKAISDLDPKRVQGGQATKDSWKVKLQQMKALLDNISESSQILASLDILCGTTLTTISTTHLGELLHKAETLQKDTESLSPTNPDMLSKISELIHFIKFKRGFFSYYEERQKQVFLRYPLTQMIETSQSDILNNMLRLTLLVLIRNKEASAWTWTETLPSIDPNKPAYVPPNKGPPLHMQPIFENFLETQILDPNFSKVFPSDDRPLAGIAQARLGIDSSVLLARTFQDIQKHAEDVLTAYKNSIISEAQNEFMAMTLYCHIIKIIMNDLHPQTMHPDTVPIYVNHTKLIQIILTMWPKLIKASLCQKSFQEATLLLHKTLKPLFLKVSELTLENNIHNSKCDCSDALLFFPKKWKPIDIQSVMWEHPSFMSICKNQARARITFLTLALKIIDPTILNQLWSSLNPANTSEPTSYSLLFNYLIASEFDKTVPSTFLEPGNPNPVYAYGIQTGNIMGTNSYIQQKTTHHPKVTAFEIALGAIIFQIPIKIFITDKNPVLTSPELGDMLLVSELLDCTGTSEPFKTMLEAPKHPLHTNLNKQYVSPQHEIEIFARQASWLQHVLSTSNFKENIIVTIDNSATFLNAYTVPENFGPTQDSFCFIPKTDSLQWPRHTFTTFMPLVEIPTNIDLYYATVTEPFENTVLSTMFNVFPKELLPAPDIPEQRPPSKIPTPTEEKTYNIEYTSKNSDHENKLKQTTPIPFNNQEEIITAPSTTELSYKTQYLQNPMRPSAEPQIEDIFSKLNISETKHIAETPLLYPPKPPKTKTFLSPVHNKTNDPKSIIVSEHTNVKIRPDNLPLNGSCFKEINAPNQNISNVPCVIPDHKVPLNIRHYKNDGIIYEVPTTTHTPSYSKPQIFLANTNNNFKPIAKPHQYNQIPKPKIFLNHDLKEPPSQPHPSQPNQPPKKSTDLQQSAQQKNSVLTTLPAPSFTIQHKPIISISDNYTPNRPQKLSPLPSIKTKPYITLEDIQNNTEALYDKSPITIPIAENLAIEPIISVSYLEKKVKETKFILLEFIKHTKLNVIKTTNLLINQIMKIKALYL
ncbi:large tegument protein [Ateline gammaherpesvirus 3]|uniref:Large tegument protein n=1 Tax=Ateline herpesvirus 3 TaxID=85618 RepID=Q9YTK3_ATHV3|nr:large tegument protein [Ateline gammaherpesvirus 3]AAC95588.1 large tegument protein [Ateline gammaherpesvirus 3]